MSCWGIFSPCEPPFPRLRCGLGWPQLSVWGQGFFFKCLPSPGMINAGNKTTSRHICWWPDTAPPWVKCRRVHMLSSHFALRRLQVAWCALWAVWPTSLQLNKSAWKAVAWKTTIFPVTSPHLQTPVEVYLAKSSAMHLLSYTSNLQKAQSHRHVWSQKYPLLHKIRCTDIQASLFSLHYLLGSWAFLFCCSHSGQCPLHTAPGRPVCIVS